MNVAVELTRSFNHELAKAKLVYTAMKTKTWQATNYISIVNIVSYQRHVSRIISQIKRTAKTHDNILLKQMGLLNKNNLW